MASGAAAPLPVVSGREASASVPSVRRCRGRELSPPGPCSLCGSDRTQVLPSQLNMVEFHWDPTKRIPSSCRSIASALSSHLRKKVERMVSLSTSRLTPSSSVTRGFHLRTCILLALSSKYLRPCSSPSITLDTSQCSPAKGITWTALFMPQDLNPGASISETQQWLHWHPFSRYCQMLTNFTGPFLTA
ncbi:uncharacterized protein isoform X4 [Castor canadensis]|uniref:Uncharacterized protein isoform X4 n=1 Tax=Castor canadensis TaxID=51338 RepID=A0AC58KAR0_CASCN